jgi:hypothetical protein
MKKKTKKTVSISPSKLIAFLKQQLNNLPDSRIGSNKQYSIEYVVIAAFSVFFTQCPSFLEHQKLMKKKKAKGKVLSLK